MQAAGVNLVLDATTFANMASFVNASDKQGWKPQYVVNAYNGNDVGLFYSGMPASWNGAIAITYRSLPGRAGSPENPLEKECRTRYNKQSGDEFQRDDVNISQILTACTHLDMFVAAAQRAGAELNRGRFSGAVQTLGRFRFAGLGGTFGPGKLDWADAVRAMVWGKNDGSTNNSNCTANRDQCWNNSGPGFDPRS